MLLATDLGREPVLRSRHSAALGLALAQAWSQVIGRLGQLAALAGLHLAKELDQVPRRLLPMCVARSRLPHPPPHTPGTCATRWHRGAPNSPMMQGS